jgi:hypothetical protein
MNLPTPNVRRHFEEEERQRLGRIDRAELTTLDLVHDLTDTIASSRDVERQIMVVGRLALEYRNALRDLRALVASHD